MPFKKYLQHQGILGVGDKPSEVERKLQIERSREIAEEIVSKDKKRAGSI